MIVMEDLFQELLKIKEKYLELCVSNCKKCPFDKIIFEHEGGYETICDALDKIS